MMMDMKTTIAISAIVITAFGIIAATSIIGSDNAFAEYGHHGKWCNPHDCKGDKGWYTKKGHHHCFKGFHGCVESGYHKRK